MFANNMYRLELTVSSLYHTKDSAEIHKVSCDPGNNQSLTAQHKPVVTVTTLQQ